MEHQILQTQVCGAKTYYGKSDHIGGTFGGTVVFGERGGWFAGAALSNGRNSEIRRGFVCYQGDLHHRKQLDRSSY